MGEGDDKWNYNLRVTRFAVEESFRGNIGKQVDVVARVILPTPIAFPDGSAGEKHTSVADCSYKFTQGERYIVYANRSQKKDGTLAVGFNRTRTLGKADEDLEYVRGLARGTKPGASIYGTITRRDRDLRSGNIAPGSPVANIKIMLDGMSRNLETTTDVEGRYRFNGLPPGAYDIKAVMPPHLAPVKDASKANVVERGCAEVDFYTQADGRISGRVFDVQGQPVPKMRVDLVLAELENERHPQALWAYADETGRYELKSIPPGRYYLGIRLDSIRDPDFPYPRTYYPSVQETAKAEVIEISEGERLKNHDIHLPQPLAERTIEGVVAWPDGQPAAGASVSLTITEYEYNFAPGGGGVADEQGRFKVRAFEGLKYWIGALVSTKKIPGGQMHAEPFDIPADGDVRNIRLVIESPMGNCPRCRDRIWRPNKKQLKQN